MICINKHVFSMVIYNVKGERGNSQCPLPIALPPPLDQSYKKNFPTKSSFIIFNCNKDKLSIGAKLLTEQKKFRPTEQLN